MFAQGINGLFLSSYFPGGPVAQALLKLPLHLSKLTPGLWVSHLLLVSDSAAL